MSAGRLVRSLTRPERATVQERPTARIDLRVPAELGAPAVARRGVAALCTYAGDPLMGDLLLLVSELVTNSVRHGGLRAEDSIHVRVALAPASARLDVCDPGVGFRPSAPRRRSFEELGGRGLFLVDRIADRWGVELGPLTRVWAEIDRT